VKKEKYWDGRVPYDEFYGGEKDGGKGGIMLLETES